MKVSLFKISKIISVLNFVHILVSLNISPVPTLFSLLDKMDIESNITSYHLASYCQLTLMSQ